jgi:CBS domain-containing protein
VSNDPLGVGRLARACRGLGGEDAYVVHTVGDVMTTPVVTVSPGTTFKEAVRTLTSRRVSGLPVVDADGRLVGIVSEADLLSKAEKRNADAYMLESKAHRLDRARAMAVDVASAMSRDVATVRSDFPIALAAREMHDRGFKRLPVVDERGKLVGIVSRGDLLRVFLRSDRQLGDEVRKVLKSAQSHLGGRQLTANVSGGVVELEGAFQSRARLEATVRAITRIDGVVGIRSHLVFDADDLEPRQGVAL